MALCLAPLVFAGYMFTLVQYPNVNSPGVEVQTCEKGLGLHAKAYPDNAYALGTQYGVMWESGKWTWGFQPQIGLAHSYKGESKKYFEVGMQFTVGYDHVRVGVEYWHMSNAGLSSPNGGLDMLVVQTGWRF
jgi:hypothetical protein